MQSRHPKTQRNKQPIHSHLLHPHAQKKKKTRQAPLFFPFSHISSASSSIVNISRSAWIFEYTSLKIQ